MKDDNSKPSIQKISCNNINNNNIDLGDATNDEAISSSSDVSPSFSNVDSQPDKKGDFVDPCLNNNNVKIITNNFNTGTTINNNNLNIERNNAVTQDITQSNEACTNIVAANEDGEGDQDVGANRTNQCTVTQSNDASGIEEDNGFNDFPGVITSSSI